MAEHGVRLDFCFGTRGLRLLMAAGSILSSAAPLACESVTLTTYYPAPSGVYAQMITTGNTYLARDAAASGGKVGIGTFNPQGLLDIEGTGGIVLNAGNVGIGTASAAHALTVNGGVQLGDDGSACPGLNEGTLKWHDGALWDCTAAGWVPTTPDPPPTLSSPVSLLVGDCPLHCKTLVTVVGASVCPSPGLGAISAIQGVCPAGTSGYVKAAALGCQIYYCFDGTISESPTQITATQNAASYTWSTDFSTSSARAG